MNSDSSEKYAYRTPEGMWSKVFSYHPFMPFLERAEGVYLYDKEGNRYFDVSGDPMAVGIPHGDKRVKEAINQQLDRYAYCHPIISDQAHAVPFAAASTVIDILEKDNLMSITREQVDELLDAVDWTLTEWKEKMAV